MSAYKPGDSVRLNFDTCSSTGALVAADSTPALVCNRNGTDDGTVTITVTSLATGRYKATLTLPSSYAAGDSVNFHVAATIGGVAAGTAIGPFVLDGYRLSNVVGSILPTASANTTGGLPVNSASLQVATDAAPLVQALTEAVLALGFSSTGTVYGTPQLDAVNLTGLPTNAVYLPYQTVLCPAVITNGGATPANLDLARVAVAATGSGGSWQFELGKAWPGTASVGDTFIVATTRQPFGTVVAQLSGVTTVDGHTLLSSGTGTAQLQTSAGAVFVAVGGIASSSFVNNAITSNVIAAGAINTNNATVNLSVTNTASLTAAGTNAGGTVVTTANLLPAAVGQIIAAVRGGAR